MVGDVPVAVVAKFMGGCRIHVWEAQERDHDNRSPRFVLLCSRRVFLVRPDLASDHHRISCSLVEQNSRNSHQVAVTMLVTRQHHLSLQS